MLPLFANYGVNLLVTPYIVSHLGLHNYGIWSMTAATVQYLALSDLGVARAANRYVAFFHAKSDWQSERSVVGICFTALVGLSCILYLLPPVFADFMSGLIHLYDAQLTESILFASVTMLSCGLLSRTLAAVAIGRGRQIQANIGMAIFGVAQVVGGVIALLRLPTLLNFAWGTGTGAVVGFIVVVMVILVDDPDIRIGLPQGKLAREVLAYGVKGQILGAADILWYQSGSIIAGILIGPSAAGAFDLGIRLVRGAQSFGSAASVALTTHLTRLYAVGGPEALLGEYCRLTRRNAAVAVFPPLLLLATVLSAIPLWLGIKQHEVILVAACFAPGVAVNVATGVCTATLLSMGRSGAVAATTSVSAAVGVVLAVAFGHAFGFGGIAGAFGIWMVLANLLQVAFLQRSLQIGMKQYLRAVRGPFVLGIAAAAGACLIGVFADAHTRVAAFLPFVLSAVVFSATYAMLGWRLDYLPQMNVLSRRGH